MDAESEDIKNGQWGLSIHEFWYPQWALEPIPMDMKDNCIGLCRRSPVDIWENKVNMQEGRKKEKCSCSLDLSKPVAGFELGSSPWEPWKKTNELLLETKASPS